MTIKEAIKERHMVRRYTDKAIPTDIVELINARIAENNKKYNLDLALVLFAFKWIERFKSIERRKANA